MGKIKNFAFNIWFSITKSIVFFITAYTIPIVNILVLLFINNGKLKLDVTLCSIILATISCTLICIGSMFVDNDKQRSLTKNILIATTILSLIPFIFTVLESSNILKLKLNLYFYSMIFFFIASLLFILIAKFDESEAERKGAITNISKQAETTNSASIANREVKL